MAEKFFMMLYLAKCTSPAPRAGPGESSVANVSRTLPSLIDAFRATQEEEVAWMAAATEEECAATLTHPLIPGGGCTAGAALTQVCLHSHAHRAQIATRLRGQGGVPPQTDFIVWLVERQPPDWGSAASQGRA